ncbi:MAG: pyridoxamine 5'-phosphate oxidase family protein, partial [Streptomyces sp.]|uniref:pyridoxamine 5'-phosphate oxidase family protein n=1 Tax=Streptomyces sp. TaxID=1931 RepID=UPI003D6B22DE
MAEAEGAYPWDGQDALTQHEREHEYEHERVARYEHGAAASQRPHSPANLPGGEGEHALQRRLGTVDRAQRFYDEQMLDHLNERMREFVQRQEMFFLSTSDARGECDSSFRAGPRGFLQVLDERTVTYPEYRGNGVHASLGNIQENPHLGIMLIDFVRARIGLHINGRATIVEDEEIRASYPHLPADPVPGRRAQLWVRVEVEEAYIHCAKHIPQLQKAPKRTARDWGTDDYKRKGGDFFGAARDARDARESGDGTGEPAGRERDRVPARARAAEPAVGDLFGNGGTAGVVPQQEQARVPAPEPAPEPGYGRPEEPVVVWQ